MMSQILLFLMRGFALAFIGTICWWLGRLILRRPRSRRLTTTMLGMLLALPMMGESLYVFLDEPMIDAAREGNVAQVRTLLFGGADVDAPHDDGVGTALIAASIENHPEIVKALIQHGANVNQAAEASLPNQAGHEQMLTPLDAASGHPEIIALLKRAGAKD